MANAFWYTALFAYFFCIAASIAEQRTEGRTIGQNPSRNQVSNLFSEVGNLFLDIDETFSRQTAPKVEVESQIAEQILGDRRTPLREYFTQIQSNYRKLQDRIGPAIVKVSELLPRPDVGRINIKERDGKAYVDASIPLIPLRLFPISNTESRSQEVSTIQNPSASNGLESRSSRTDLRPSSDSPESKAEKKDPETVTKDTEEIKPQTSSNPFAKYDHEQKFKPKTDDQGKPKTVPEADIKATAENLLENAQRTNNLLLSLGRRTLDEISDVVPKTDSMSPVHDSETSGRILGDTLYSESTYDDYLRQLLRSSGKWLLDSPLLSPKRDTKKTVKVTPGTAQDSISETEDATSKTYDPHRVGLIDETTTETSNPPKKLETKMSEALPNTNSKESVSAYYYDLTKEHSGERQEILDIIMHSDPSKSSGTFAELAKDGEKNAAVGKVILAFTPDGVPLKLRLGPEIENPIKFLHKTLRTAGVSLNIPVQSYDDIEPAGREILQLGSVSGGAVSRTLSLDLSNSYELKSLIRTLKKSKRFQKP